MKHLYKCILLFFFIPTNGHAQVTNTFTTFSMSNVPEFTTNNFKCIGVGKGNLIWAGTQYGGLYMYSDSFNIWRKSTQLTNVYINDIKMDGDSGIWIAQSGQQSIGGNSNIAGGVNYFPVNSELSMRFFSVLGTTTSADLLSRNARALYVDKSWRSALGRLPRPWVAQGTFITSFNTKRGGLSVGLNPFAPYFTNKPDGFSTVTTATPICESVGGNGQKIWAATRLNNGGSQILQYTPSGLYDSAYSSTNTALLPAGFTAQAIYFDQSGNRWIGLRQGGLVILTPGGWVKMDNESRIPPGTAINPNAITGDEFGNVYIGTSSGMLEFLSPDYYASSSPDNVNSYKLYTTSDGLPSNNINGITYDRKNGKILITSDAGVTFMNRREPFIKGVVFDVYTSIDSTNNKYAGLQKKPFSGGVSVTLLRDGVGEETVRPDANGIFELKEAEDNVNYTVEVKYTDENSKVIRYLYSNVRNHTLMQPSLIPDSLIGEIKAFKDKMARRCFPIKLTFDFEYGGICTSGFNMEGYDLAYQPFYAAGGVADEHEKKVDNLANYYASLATVYALGGNAVDLNTDMIANALDAVEMMIGTFTAAKEARAKAAETPESDPFVAAGISAIEEALKSTAAMIKARKEALVFGLKKVSGKLTDPDSKATLDRAITCINDAADLLAEFLSKGGSAKAPVFKAIIDNLKKAIATEAAAIYYREFYARERHEHFIYEASNSSTYGVSEFTYQEAYDNLYSKSSQSLAKDGADTLKNRKALIELFANISKMAEFAESLADATTLLAAAFGGPAAAAIAKGISYGAKVTKVAALVAGMYNGAIGCHEEAELSEQIDDKSGLLRPAPADGYRPTAIAQVLTDSLVIRKNAFNQKLTELKAVYDASIADSVTYGVKYKQFLVEDSLYTRELSKTMHSMWAASDSASKVLPAFQPRLDRVVDSFTDRQITLRSSLDFMNLAYLLDPSKTPYIPALDSLINDIKIANDSAVNGMVALAGDINNNNIPGQPYLEQESYRISHTHQLNSTGTVFYTFKNYGSLAQNNVSFKISAPTGGYTLTSTDSIYVGTIQPGVSKQISFTFSAPLNSDSIGRYTINAKASNGIYRNTTGTLYVIDPGKFYSVKNGNWNDPATWSANAIPGANNPVHVSHSVTVTADAVCKSVTVFAPGFVTVNTGKKITVTR